jgi:hypothetical protein
MVRIPLPGLPDVNVNLPEINLPDLPKLPGLPGLPSIPNINVEREFWEIVDDIDRVSLKYQLPVPMLRPILDQFSLIDSDRMRAAAKVWGTSLADLGIPATVAADVPKKVNETLLTLTERWQGQAYTNFKQWMGDLNDVVGQYGAPAHTVGGILTELADSYDLTKLEVFSMVGAVAGFVMAALAFAIPEPIVTKGLAMFLACLGAALATIDLFISILDGVWPRIQAAMDAVDKLTDEVNSKIPRADDASVRLPNRNQWQPRSTDPYS